MTLIQRALRESEDNIRFEANGSKYQITGIIRPDASGTRRINLSTGGKRRIRPPSTGFRSDQCCASHEANTLSTASCQSKMTTRLRGQAAAFANHDPVVIQPPPEFAEHKHAHTRTVPNATPDTMGLQTYRFQIRPGEKLGMSICTHAEGIMCKKVKTGGAAYTNRVQPGKLLISVNGQDVSKISEPKCVDIIGKAALTGSIVLQFKAPSQSWTQQQVPIKADLSPSASAKASSLNFDSTANSRKQPPATELQKVLKSTGDQIYSIARKHQPENLVPISPNAGASKNRAHLAPSKLQSDSAELLAGHMIKANTKSRPNNIMPPPRQHSAPPTIGTGPTVHGTSDILHPQGVRRGSLGPRNSSERRQHTQPIKKIPTSNRMDASEQVQSDVNINEDNCRTTSTEVMDGTEPEHNPVP